MLTKLNIKKYKAFINFYILWFFYRFTILINKDDVSSLKRISYEDIENDYYLMTSGRNAMHLYDITEFIYYLVLPFIILILWKLNEKYLLNVLKKYKSKIFKYFNKVKQKRKGNNINKYYYKIDGEIYGPIHINELIKLIKADTLIREENNNEWIPACVNADVSKIIL